MRRIPVWRIAFLVLCVPLLAFAGKDPADYPLKVHILQQNWASHNVRRSEYKATGRGNIWEGDSVRAFDFTYDCSVGLRRTARNQPYMAKWKKPQAKLAILSEKIGKEDKYDECDVQTTVHDGVYMLGGGGITEITQEQYKTRKAEHAQAPPAGAN